MPVKGCSLSHERLYGHRRDCPPEDGEEEASVCADAAYNTFAVLASSRRRVNLLDLRPPLAHRAMPSRFDTLFSMSGSFIVSTLQDQGGLACEPRQFACYRGEALTLPLSLLQHHGFFGNRR